MSEYQYYGFRALDEVLSPAAKKAVSALSSRSIVTSHQAEFIYNYGDFRGDPEKLLAKYFDMMFYIANFGSTRLMFKFPKSLINVKAITEYCIPDSITVKTVSKFIIVDICINDEEASGWIDEDNWLDQLVPLRDAVMMEDYRVLYLAWLKATEYEESDGNELPIIPNNLSKLNPNLKNFIQIFNVNKDLVKQAAKKSKTVSSSLAIDSEKLIKKLPASEKNDFLNRLFNGESNLKVKLKNRILAF